MIRLNRSTGIPYVVTTSVEQVIAGLEARLAVLESEHQRALSLKAAAGASGAAAQTYKRAAQFVLGEVASL